MKKITHFAKGNRNFAKGTFKSLCHPLPITESDKSECSYTIERVDCLKCLEVYICIHEANIEIAHQRVLNIKGIAT